MKKWLEEKKQEKKEKRTTLILLLFIVAKKEGNIFSRNEWFGLVVNDKSRIPKVTPKGDLKNLKYLGFQGAFGCTLWCSSHVFQDVERKTRNEVDCWTS